MFGVDLNSPNWQTSLASSVKDQTGIHITIEKTLGWDTEVKPDETGKDAFYVYVDCLCNYKDGELKPGPGIEKLAWIPINELKQYDIVPPALKLLTTQGYL